MRDPSGSESPAPWQRALAEAVTTPGELLRLLGLDPALASAEACADFPLRVPRGFVARMRRGDPGDPLLRQVLPIAAETRARAGFTVDPLGERALGGGVGVLRKYAGRALIVATGACGVHCRYCFRRHFPYEVEGAQRGRFAAALAVLRGDPSLEEAILSGGDPLSLGDRALGELIERLSAIDHLRRLRIHTRQPVVLPERVDPGLVRILEGTRLEVVVVVHANHANELDRTVERAMTRLDAAGATLLNQSVLLAGVNDDAAVLAALSERLFAIGVLPYYLHLLDPVDGAAHFEVGQPRAEALVSELAARLPGYLVPRLAREEVGAASKRVIGYPHSPPAARR